VTQGEKLLLRLAQHRGKLVKLTVLIGPEGEPMIIVIEEEARAESLLAGGWPDIKRLSAENPALNAT